MEKNSINLSDLFKRAMGPCPSADDLFSYVNGEETSLKVDAHLKYCPFCKKEFEIIKSELEIPEQNAFEILKSLAYSFIKKYYPDEDIIFDVAWDILKDFKGIKLRPSRSFTNALAMVGKDEQNLSDLITPVVIVAILGSFRYHGETLENVDINGFTETAEKIAKKNRASAELVGSIREHIFNFFK